MASKTEYTYRVEPSDVDFTLRAGLVPMARYILDTAGYDADAKGFGVQELNRENRSWVLSRMALDMDRLPREYESFSVTTWVNDYGRLVTTRNFTVADAEGRRIGSAVTLWAMIDLATRRSLDLRYVGERPDALCADPSPAEPPCRIGAVTPDCERVHPVLYSDIDFNRHVGTLRYLAMMLDMLPLELLAAGEGVRLDLNFLREARYGQTLAVGRERRGERSLFEVRNEAGEAVCRGSLAMR